MRLESSLYQQKCYFMKYSSLKICFLKNKDLLNPKFLFVGLVEGSKEYFLFPKIVLNIFYVMN